MAKNCFENEYEINASQRILYPYLNTAGGLSQWFADNVTIDYDKKFNFHLDGEVHRARIAAVRRDQYIRFEYLPENGHKTEGGDPDFLEFHLEKNDFTDSTFLRIKECSSEDMDAEELREIWDGLVGLLREMVGG
jgi:uncharacterized protein YndB with AHSA1/START domain